MSIVGRVIDGCHFGAFRTIVRDKDYLVCCLFVGCVTVASKRARALIA